MLSTGHRSQGLVQDITWGGGALCIDITGRELKTGHWRELSAEYITGGSSTQDITGRRLTEDITTQLAAPGH
jgi:hypothetical protein